MFKTFVKEVPQDLSLGESGSESSYFITEPRNFSEVTKMSDYKKKTWVKATENYIKILINNRIFLDGYAL